MGDEKWFWSAGRGDGTRNRSRPYARHSFGLAALYSQMEWRLTFEAWKIIVNSHHMQHELGRLFSVPQDKTVVIPNGTDPYQFDFDFDYAAMRRRYAADHEQIILYVGRLVREKGVQILLNAAPAVFAQRPGTRILIVGSGYYSDELKRQAYALGIAHQVSFLGYVDDDELKRLYKIADAVCIPSLYEPFGIVALEGISPPACRLSRRKPVG